MIIDNSNLYGRYENDGKLEIEKHNMALWEKRKKDLNVKITGI